MLLRHIWISSALVLLNLISCEEMTTVYMPGQSSKIAEMPGGNTSAGSSWYVRPLGGSYGSENGRNYTNAFDGFININWTITGVQPGDTLFVCGTHTEDFHVLGSGVDGSPITIRGDYPGDAGIIDSEDTRNTGLDCNNRNYITITNLTSIDALVDCFQFHGTSTGIITNGITATGSGNQGIQHEDTASATHNNATSSNNIDDGVSGHDSATIVINGGTFENNDEGINCVEDAQCTINGPVTFSGNTTLDIWAAAATTEESCLITVNDVIIPMDVLISSRAKIILNNCTIPGTTRIGTLAGTAYFEAYDCDFSGLGAFGTDGESIFEDCTVRGGMSIASGATVDMANCLITTWGISNIVGEINLSECYVTDNNEVDGTLTAEYTLFEGGTDHLIDAQNGSTVTLKYCVFNGMNTGDFGVSVRTGSTVTVDGCSFIGAANVGKGFFSQITQTIDNCIFTNLETGVHQTGGVVTTNNCVYFDNTANTAGTVTQNNSQAGNPLLVDVSNNDFSLGVGSSAIGNGLDLGASLDDGIDAATWGNGTTGIPTVTTKEQAVAWDIGAYIS